MHTRERAPARRVPYLPVQIDGHIQPLIDALSANVAILVLDGSICAVNAAWRNFAEANGCRSEAFCVGMNYLDVCAAAAKSCPEAAIVATALRAVIEGKSESYESSYILELADGTHHFKLTLSRIVLPDSTYISVCHEDVTALIRLEEQRRAHALELIQAQDEERKQIARELHDSTAQHLTSIGLLSGILMAREASDESASLLRELTEVVAQAQMEIRTFSYLLHPPLLAEVGLQAALGRYVDGFSRRTGIDVSFAWDLPPDERLQGLEHAILRVVQEALTNVYRHSGAKKADVLIEAREGEARVIVSDPGSQGWREDEGVGIPSMRSRVAEFGGTLNIDHDSRGTRVLATLPLLQTPSDGR